MKRGEVVDVVGQVRDVRQRRVAADAGAQRFQMLALERGDLAEVGEVVVAGREARGRLRRSAPQGLGGRARRPSGASSPNDGCTRLTISACTDWPASASRSAKNVASCIASRRGEVTSTNAVAGSARSSPTTAARSRKPSSMPSNARKNATTSSITSEPTTRATVRRNVWTATLATRRYARVGIISSRNTRLSSSRVSRCGASRKSSA